jgi:hypothetical protein
MASSRQVTSPNSSQRGASSASAIGRALGDRPAAIRGTSLRLERPAIRAAFADRDFQMGAALRAAAAVVRAVLGFGQAAVDMTAAIPDLEEGPARPRCGGVLLGLARPSDRRRRQPNPRDVNTITGVHRCPSHRHATRPRLNGGAFLRSVHSTQKHGGHGLPQACRGEGHRDEADKGLRTSAEPCSPILFAFSVLPPLGRLGASCALCASEVLCRNSADCWTQRGEYR